MYNVFDKIVIHDAIATGDMVQVKPYLHSTESGVAFEGEHSGKVGIIAAFSPDIHHRRHLDKAVLQIRHDDGTLETFTHDIDGLVLLERRAQDRD